MDSPVLGLHHVTATADGAQADLDFYASALGLRLVKKTVNFDNHHVYHFYYGDERGTPGTIWTTFPYRGQGVRAGTKGTGQITTTSFSVPHGSLAAWKSRLGARGVTVEEARPRFGEEAVIVTDPSGLAIELIANDRDSRPAWAASPVEAAAAIRGLYSVTMTLESPDQTVDFMTRVLGFRVAGEMEGRIRLTVNGDEPGKAMEILSAPETTRGINGLGTVHHVAMAVATGDDQLRMRQELIGRGCRVTDVLDRQYFTSIYFREPGGVLFEIATMPPGFLIDEPLAGLGRALKLPHWEESNRPEIEAGLPPVVHP